MKPTEQLSLSEELAPQESALALSPVNPIGRMIEAITKTGVSPDNMAVLERMMALYEQVEAKNAEKQFNAAFVALQAEIPVIVATTVIPNRGKYERFEDVMRVVGPLLQKHGFSVSFSMDFKESRILETCHLRHVGGYSQSNSFAVRAGGKADSETQADCKAATTAKRNALLNCLNIVIRQDALLNEDQDASLEGEFIKPDQVVYLRELLAETKSDVSKFLSFAGADKLEEIGSARYDNLVAALHRKQRGL